MVSNSYTCKCCGASFTTDDEHKDKTMCRSCLSELEDTEIEDTLDIDD